MGGRGFADAIYTSTQDGIKGVSQQDYSRLRKTLLWLLW